MSQLFTPFVKQCLVTFGASINMGGATLLMAYTTGMLLQLRKPDSDIPVNTAEESWIASMPAISSLLGSSLMSVTMSRNGRKFSQVTSIIFLIIGWLIIAFANNIAVLLIGRFFHGLAMGSSIILTPILTAEYSSPRYRGSLMMFPTFIAGLNCLMAQTMGLHLSWRTNAFIFTGFAVFNLPIALYSPESPIWLASKERYDDCKVAFRWLRGEDEEKELANMIRASEISHTLLKENTSSEMTTRKRLVLMKETVMKKEFYKPILIMLHLYTAGLWAGSYILTTYAFDLIEVLAGKGYIDEVLGLNIHRLIGGFIAVFLITKSKRRVLFSVSYVFNVIVLLVTAVFTFGKSIGMLSNDLPIIGLCLLHSHMFIVSTCTMSLPFILAGEIIPLKYKSVASGICCTFLFISTGIYIKTFPFLLKSISLHGTYVLYSVVIVYCVVIAFFYLPETKDRTLQEIEEEFTGKPVIEELKSAQPLINT